MKKSISILLSCCFILFAASNGHAVPPVTGLPVPVQHLGKMEWPQDVATSTPYLTQLVHNDLNDLHGDLSCELIISTAGNFYMALKDALYGAPDLGHVGLIEQRGTLPQFKVSICWTTSPPIAVDHITAGNLQIKNIKIVGRPSLAMGPSDVMDTLVAKGLVDGVTRQTILTNRGNVILVRADKAGTGPGQISNICGLGGTTRVVTPDPALEPGAFSNFSGTIFNVANLNSYGCDATTLFNNIFSQNIASFDLTPFNNPFNIDGVMSVFGRGSLPQGTGPKWVTSTRIMHRDLPYALCHDEADAAVIFYHLAKELKASMAATGCALEIIPMGGTVENPQPLNGNRVGKVFIAKVNGSYAKKVNDARDVIYNFLSTNPVWDQILLKHGMTR